MQKGYALFAISLLRIETRERSYNRSDSPGFTRLKCEIDGDRSRTFCQQCFVIEMQSNRNTNEGKVLLENRSLCRRCQRFENEAMRIRITSHPCEKSGIAHAEEWKIPA